MDKNLKEMGKYETSRISVRLFISSALSILRNQNVLFVSEGPHFSQECMIGIGL